MGSIVLSADYSDHIAIKKAHYHDCHQLLFVTGGSACVSVNNTVRHVSAGDLIIFSRLEHHAVTMQSQNYRRYILELASEVPALIQNRDRVHSILFNRPMGFCNIIDVRDAQTSFCQLFEKIHLETQSQYSMREDMLDLLVYQLLISIYRHIQDNLPHTDGDYFNIIYEIQLQFQREFQKQYTLRKLSAAYNISSSYLSHLFKHTTGSSIMGYLQSCRIAEAKKCLVDTNMRIDEIVDHCGFSDCSNFSRTFKKINGCSPSHFRDQALKADDELFL